MKVSAESQMTNKLRSLNRDRQRLLRANQREIEKLKSSHRAYRENVKTENQIIERNSTIASSMKEATNIPFKTLQCCRDIMDLALLAAQKGNTNSVSDAGVSGEMANAGARGAALNILINLKDIDDSKYSKNMNQKTQLILDETDALLQEIRSVVIKVINNG